MLPYTNKRSDLADQPNIPKRGNRLLQQKQQAASQQPASHIQLQLNSKQGREEQATASNQQATSSNKPNNKQTREHNVSPRRTGQEIATNSGVTPKQNREDQTPAKPMQDKCSIKNQGQQSSNKGPACRISK
jgi:hypothetical protein